MIKKLILSIMLSTLAFSSECINTNSIYNNICKSLSKKIPVEYVNSYLSLEKSKLIDKKTIKYIHPKKRASHSKAEVRANKSILKTVPDINKHLIKYKDVYAIAESKYKINKEIIAAILAKETRLGNYKPKHSSYITSNTMALHLPETSNKKKFQKMGVSNIKNLISFCYNNNIDVANCDFKSSYTGALGYAQFMPFNLYLVIPHNNINDLNNMETAILSIANYMRNRVKMNWINFETIPNMFEIESKWLEFSNNNKKSSFAIGKKYKCYSCNKPELKDLRASVKSIMKYNYSSNYALGVLLIAYSSYTSK